MTLDLFKSTNGRQQELLLSINDDDYKMLSAAFEIYKKRTGLFIDPYSTLKLNSGVAHQLGYHPVYFYRSTQYKAAVPL